MPVYAREDDNGMLELIEIPWVPAITEGLIDCSDNPELAEIKKNPAFYKIEKDKVSKKPQLEITKMLEKRDAAKEKKDVAGKIDSVLKRLEKVETENHMLKEQLSTLTNNRKG